MLGKTRVIVDIALLIATLCVLSGCNRGGSSSANSHDSEATSNASASKPSNSSAMTVTDLSGQPSGPNRCALLTDDEIRDAIGPHAPGVNAPGNGWGLQSCRWNSKAGEKELADTGLIMSSDWVEVGVFNPGGIGENAAWAREQAQGEVVKGFEQGARYDMTSGELWFECPHDRFCVVKAHTKSAATREHTTLHLAELVVKGLQ
jgi:uncharacterized protein DUF3558